LLVSQLSPFSSLLTQRDLASVMETFSGGSCPIEVLTRD
jgi:hypothetical protein